VPPPLGPAAQSHAQLLPRAVAGQIDH
jgi:hypothetical protein